MGIKPTYVKSLSEELISRYGERFTNSFEDNKHAVEELTSIGSKSVRNRVAGSVTRKMNRRKTHK
jgi:small subunit ribosomal protein S17e